jgi:SAM-dependent methyltransferase
VTALGTEFDIALIGQPSWLDLPGGGRSPLPVGRWCAEVGQADEVPVNACHGPTLDVGCGPGRLTAALTARGVIALGVDTSAVAVRLTRARGAMALRRDVFGKLPGEGRWQHVLLVDGNIGIGGDPVVLLRRVHGLLRPGGSALVEVEPPGNGLRRGQVRVRTLYRRGRWFDWAWLGADRLAFVAVASGFTVSWLTERSGRWFAALEKG